MFHDATENIEEDTEELDLVETPGEIDAEIASLFDSSQQSQPCHQPLPCYPSHLPFLSSQVAECARC